MDTIQKKLEKERKELLDLGLRNTLINYKTLKTKGIEIIEELPEQVFQILVNKGKKMSFLSLPKKLSAEKNYSNESNNIPMRFQPDDDDDIEIITDSHQNKKLQTPYTSDKLQKRLLNTYYAYRTYIEEQGVNILFLALGMLKWYESSSSNNEIKSPLVLIPVELIRTNVQSKFRISYTGEHGGHNLSLYTKLEKEFALKLPIFPELEDLDLINYFNLIEAAIKDKANWSIDKNSIILGFFTFGKFLMYNDLDISTWPKNMQKLDNTVIAALLNDGFKKNNLQLGENVHLDEVIEKNPVHNVVSADSSQLLTILDVKQGANLVIQGPPGTGKSQTITNLIAEALSENKKILFVAEKMAALEVVKRRLDKVLLGDACLELHSHKTRKKDVLEELKRTYNTNKNKIVEFKKELNIMKDIRSRLNNYCEAVNKSIANSNITPYQIYGYLLQLKPRLKSIKEPLPEINIPFCQKWTKEEFNKKYQIVKNLQLLIEQIGIPYLHSFWGTDLKVSLPADRMKIVETLKEILNIIEKFQKGKLSKVYKKYNFPDPVNFTNIKIIFKTFQRLIDIPDLKGVNIKTELWATNKEKINSLLNKGECLYKIQKKYEDILTQETWEQDVIEIKQYLEKYGYKWWGFIVSGFRKANKKLREFFNNQVPKNINKKIEIIEAILESQRLKKEIENNLILGQELFGIQWKSYSSNWTNLKKTTNWLIKIYEDIYEKTISEKIIFLLNKRFNKEKLKEYISKFESEIKSYQTQISKFIKLLKFNENTKFGKHKFFLTQPFEVQKNRINEMILHIDSLSEMTQYNIYIDELKKEGISSIAKLADTWKFAKKYLADIFKYYWLNELLKFAMSEHKILAQFNGLTHQNNIKKFRELDEKSLNFNQKKLALNHLKSLKQIDNTGQIEILLREFNKKRRHLSIRKLMTAAGNTIQVIKPVFMMSPMSIATYLPIGAVNFDLIIFDEASQVKPVDAFGAIIRGKQTVVVGDDKQLPPTRFFDTINEIDEESESYTSDLESILSLFNVKGAPSRLLRWHYRSRHESLIMVSNQEFYNNGLVVFPSPDADRSNTGIKYHFLSNTYYDRSRGRNNREEAKIVAKAVMKHAQNFPEKSLGVGTFSISQMQTIIDELEILRRENPSCENFFNTHTQEPFFVKNLENVQGDERDIIFVSIGYGKDYNGHLTMNFGPLNHNGGERRLNVLITRARERCEIFTNLDPNDIDTSKTQAQGIIALKKYLIYAKTGKTQIPVVSGRDIDSPFELEVANALKNLNYEVVHQVGSAGFFIDLAIKDFTHPGYYLLGIECDGANYHSARTARDRDKIRQSILENLGWEIHRIWSTDWFQNPEREIRKTVEAINKAKARKSIIRKN